MKYFAKLDSNNIVIGTTHVGENNAPTEEAGIEYLNNLHDYSRWKQCSKDESVRKNGASINMTYDESRDAFIRAQSPFASWVFNETTCRWEAPVAYPDDGERYEWNEETTSWDERT